MDQLSDQELIELSRERPEAFGVLVRRHQAFVYGAALRVVRDRTWAEELAQEAFLRAYRASNTFRGDSAVRTWLYRIVTNLALNAVTRRREQPVEEVPEHVHAESPAGSVERLHQIEDLHAALEQLPEPLRAPLVMKEFEYLSYKQIAERMNIPENTVRTRIHRAKLALREEMAEWADD